VLAGDVVALMRNLIHEVRARLTRVFKRSGLRGWAAKTSPAGVDTPEARRRFWTEFREGQREADVRVSGPR